MGRDLYVAYEESTPWPVWAAALVWAGFLVPAVLLGREALDRLGGGDPGGALLHGAGAAALLLGPVVTRLLLGRLQVRVTRTSLLLVFGYLPFVQRLVPFEDIRRMEAVRYSPLRDFGGWGIRWGGPGRKAWTMRGDRALRLTLRDGSELYVGSDDPERLLERVRSAGGSRWPAAGGDP